MCQKGFGTLFGGSGLSKGSVWSRFHQLIDRQVFVILFSSKNQSFFILYPLSLLASMAMNPHITNVTLIFLKWLHDYIWLTSSRILTSLLVLRVMRLYTWLMTNIHVWMLIIDLWNVHHTFRLYFWVQLLIVWKNSQEGWKVWLVM